MAKQTTHKSKRINRKSAELKKRAYRYFLMGLNSKEIAKLLDISYKTVQAYMQAGHWREQRKATALKLRVLELYKTGKSYGEIAKMLGVSKTTVYNYLKEARQVR